MPVFDWLTLTGTTNSQTENWTKRPGNLRTASTSLVTLDTITIATSKAFVVECTIIGRLAAAPFTSQAEFRVAYGGNTSGTVSVTANAFPGSTQSSTPLLSMSAAGATVLVSLTPTTFSTMDWQWMIYLSTV